MLPLCVAAALLATAVPAQATNVGTVHVEICGGDSGRGYVVCVTGSAVNLETWWLSVGGTSCWSTACGAYSAGSQPIPPGSVIFGGVFLIPGNAFDVCAYLEDQNGSLVASDCA